MGSVGARLGSRLGATDGGYVYPSSVGLLEGRDVGELGPSVGRSLGTLLGAFVGLVGPSLGWTLGSRDGGYVYPASVGLLEGRDVGEVGPPVGCSLGTLLGWTVGSVGAADGSVGALLG